MALLLAISWLLAISRLLAVALLLAISMLRLAVALLTVSALRGAAKVFLIRHFVRIFLSFKGREKAKPFVGRLIEERQWSG